MVRVTIAAMAIGAMVSCTSVPVVPQPSPQPAPKVMLPPEWVVDELLYDAMAPGKGSIEIHRGLQKLTVRDLQGREVIVTDCSTGKEGKDTPSGQFRILEMMVDKRSNKYGSYVSVETGQVVEPRSWLVERPPGTRYEGTPMPYWMRLTWTGVGIHVGGFPRGVRTSMGCIRMPEQIQPLIYEKSMVGMPVQIF